MFSFGEEDSTHDPNIVVRDSLFDESADQKPGQQQQQPAIPPPNPLELLDSREKVFTAGWLTYEYYDVGPTRETEECTVVVQFGRGEITLSPDVVHRLQHYYRAFSQSLEANPVFSEGTYFVSQVVHGSKHQITLCSSVHCTATTVNAQCIWLSWQRDQGSMTNISSNYKSTF